MEHVDELIPAHALRILEGEDERIVVAHLAECERCRSQLTDYEQVAASLAYAAPRAVPPPELRDRVLGSIRPVVGCGKWIGSTNRPVPAASARNFRRDCAACFWSQSKTVDQSGSRHCSA